jgi:hypothetical protein
LFAKRTLAGDLNGVWTRYPCGAACGAGELVEQQKPLEGGSWTTSALYLQGISLVRRNNEWHHFDPLGTAQVITNSSAQVVSNNVYDVFGVLRHQQGNAQTPWRNGGCAMRFNVVWGLVALTLLVVAAVLAVQLPVAIGCLLIRSPTVELLKHIHVGMTEAEVLAAAGEPKTIYPPERFDEAYNGWYPKPRVRADRPVWVYGVFYSIRIIVYWDDTGRVKYFDVVYT